MFLQHLQRDDISLSDMEFEIADFRQADWINHATICILINADKFFKSQQIAQHSEVVEMKIEQNNLM